MAFNQLHLLQSSQRDAAEALEAFVGECLSSSGIWTSARESDGIAAHRVVELTDDRVSIKGRIWLIADQRQAVFWLDIASHATTAGLLTWTLYFDLVSLRARRACDPLQAFDLIDAPEQATWRSRLNGTGLQEDGTLVATK